MNLALTFLLSLAPVEMVPCFCNGDVYCSCVWVSGDLVGSEDWFKTWQELERIEE